MALLSLWHTAHWQSLLYIHILLSLPLPTVILLACSQAPFPCLMSIPPSLPKVGFRMLLCRWGSPHPEGLGKEHSMPKTTVLKSIEMTGKRQGSVTDGLCSWVPQSQLGLKHQETLHGGWPGQIIQSETGNISSEHLLT